MDRHQHVHYHYHDHHHPHADQVPAEQGAEVPRVVPADHIAEQFATAVRDMMDQGQRRMTERVRQHYRDQPDPAAAAGKLERELKKERDTQLSRWTAAAIIAESKYWNQKAEKFEKYRLKKTIADRMGVIPQFRDPDIPKIVEAEAQATGQRIRSTIESQYEEATAATTQAVARNQGLRKAAGVVTQELSVQAVDNVVRDQVGGSMARFDKSRMGELGVTHYFWRSVGDSRVRPWHRIADGMRFSWARVPPLTSGHPQEPPLCRCGADPDLNTVTPANFTHRKTGPIVRQHPTPRRRPNDLGDPSQGEILEYKYDPEGMSLEEKKRFLQWNWVHGSKRKASILTKEAAAREFDFTDGMVYNPKGFDVPEEHIEDARKVVRSMYEDTQEALAEAGINSQRLQRGLKSDVSTPGNMESWTTSEAQANKFDGHDIEEEEFDAEQIFMWTEGPNWKNGKFGEQQEWVVLR